mgnify:CR=1 FL=1
MYEMIFSKKGLSLERLQTLIQVAQAGGITKAAHGDPVRQSLYSRQLKDLGKYFDAELVQKKGRTLELTPLGQKISAISLDFFSSLGQILDKSGKTRHPLSIGTGNVLAQWVLPDIIAKLHKQHGLSVRCSCMRTREVITQVSEGLLDLGIVRKDAIPAHLEKMDAGLIEYRLFVPRHILPESPHAPSLAAVLDNLPLAAMDVPGDYNDAVEELVKKRATAHGIQFRHSTIAEIFAMVQQGACAGILPRIIGKELDAKAYWELDIPEMKAFRRPLALCWRKRMVEIRDDTLKIIDWVAKEIRAITDYPRPH